MRHSTLAAALSAALLAASLVAGPAGPAGAQNAAPNAAPAAPPSPAAPAPTGAPAPAGDAAVGVVRDLYAAMSGALKSGAGGPLAERAGALGPTFEKAFDFPAMLQLALTSARWREIPADKQGPLTQSFARYLVATYANRLSAAAGGRFDVTPTSEARGGGRLVRSRVTDASGGDTEVDYVVSPEDKITDVLLDGTVSEVGNMRSELSPRLRSGGPDGLDAYLKQRTDKLLAAKPAAR